MAQRQLAGIAVVLGMLGSPTWGLAAPGTGHALLLYGPEGPDFTLEDRAVVAFNLQGTGRLISPSVRHVGTALVSVPEIDIAGAVEAATCGGGPVMAASIEAELETALQHVLYVHVDEAARTLERLEAMLPCVGEPISGQTVARISFLQGVALAYVKREDEAREAFRQALVVYPQLDWEARFPPGPELVFQDAIQAALRSETVRISVAPQVRQSAEVWIDGVTVDAGGGDSSIAAGRHVLQWRAESGAFVTRVLDVEVESEVTVYGRRDVAAAAISGRGCEPCRAVAVDALIRLAGEAGVAEVHLAELDLVDMLHTFVVDGAAWVQTDEGAVARRVRHRHLQDLGKVTLIAGGAMVLTGAILGLTGYAKATQLADDAVGIETPLQFDEESNQYANSRVQTYLGFALAGVGGTAMLVGVPLANSGKGRTGGRPNRVARSGVHGSVVLTPVGIGAVGRF